MNMQIETDLEINILELCIVTGILTLAFFFQFYYHELPCPLCLLQRVGFTGIAFALILNFRFGIKPSHYGLAVLSGMYIQFVSGRQILLHIVPGTGAYGHSIFGLHMYTWSFLIASFLILTNVLLLVFYQKDHRWKINTKGKKVLISFFFFALLSVTTLITIGQVISAYMECGLGQCPDNPSHYLYTQQNKPMAAVKFKSTNDDAKRSYTIV